jgi:primary-amine oxidase
VHPLDPLSAAEISAAARIVRHEKGLSDRWRFASIELREPSKDALRAGAPIPREATVIGWDRDDGGVYKARVALEPERVTRAL